MHAAALGVTHTEIAVRGEITLRGRLLKPLHGRSVVLWYAAAVVAAQRIVKLRARVALLGGLQVPLGCALHVLLHAARALLVQRTKQRLRLGVTVLSGLQVPLCCGLDVHRHAATFLEAARPLKLRLAVACHSRKTAHLCAAWPVCIRALSVQVQVGQVQLRVCKAEVGGLMQPLQRLRAVGRQDKAVVIAAANNEHAQRAVGVVPHDTLQARCHICGAGAAAAAAAATGASCCNHT